jgi:hypothetical protein
VIAGLAAAGCMQRPDVPALQAPAPDRARFVSVSGEGSFTVDPNQAHVELVLESDGATAKVAYGTGQQRLTDLKAALEAVGVRRPEMEAREYSLEETWTEADGALRKSYRMRQVIRVSVRDLVKLPETLGQAAVHGADSIRSVSFGYTNPAMLLERARERALEDARAKAKLLAEESQEQLGAVLNIVEEAAGPGGSDWLGDDDGSPYTFTVRLTATYALSDF